MHWKSYGIIVEIKKYTHNTQIITVISELGKWKGFYDQKKSNVTLFSQCICMWSGKNADSIGNWFFSDIMHLPFFNTKALYKDKYYSYLTSLYACYLIKTYFPERFACKSNLEAVIYIKDRLTVYDWKTAWIELESHLTQEQISDNATTKSLRAFFDKTIVCFRNQYQTEPLSNIRNILLNNILQV